jgi:hypothetical protein
MEELKLRKEKMYGNPIKGGVASVGDFNDFFYNKRLDIKYFILDSRGHIKGNFLGITIDEDFIIEMKGFSIAIPVSNFIPLPLRTDIEIFDMEALINYRIISFDGNRLFIVKGLPS